MSELMEAEGDVTEKNKERQDDEEKEDALEMAEETKMV